ncbi:Uncharacterised protein [Vibrio cholerae]|nr:Uncharacterised protein [Vibrio cholerae]
MNKVALSVLAFTWCHSMAVLHSDKWQLANWVWQVPCLLLRSPHYF